MKNPIKNKDRVAQTREDIGKLDALLKLVETDKVSLSQVGRDLGLSPQTINRELGISFATYFRKQTTKMGNKEIAETIKKITTPAERLLKDVFQVEGYVVFPEIDEENFWQVLSGLSFTKNQWEVLTMRCGRKQKKPFTFDEIGTKLNLTRARTNQIYADALSKITGSVLTQIIFPTEYQKVENIEVLRNSIEDKYDKAVADYQEMQELIKNTKHMNEVMKYIKSNYPELAEGLKSATKVQTEVLNTPIEKIGFSCRTYTALKKNGYLTVKDISTATAKEIWSIRNIGKKSILEITDVISKLLGVSWKATEKELRTMLNA